MNGSSVTSSDVESISPTDWLLRRHFRRKADTTLRAGAGTWSLMTDLRATVGSARLVRLRTSQKRLKTHYQASHRPSQSREPRGSLKAKEACLRRDLRLHFVSSPFSPRILGSCRDSFAEACLPGFVAQVASVGSLVWDASRAGAL